MRKIAFLLLVGIILSGCGLVFESRRNELLKTATEADYGIPPAPGYVEAEKEFILKTLKDPDSAKFNTDDCGDPVHGIIPAGFASPDPVFVWATKININGKNSYGGYVGYREYSFAWLNGKMYAYRENNFESWRYIK